MAERKLECDPWDWQDDGFKLDPESPLEITRCLWDEIPHGEEDSRFLSTPLSDTIRQDPPLYSIRGQDQEMHPGGFSDPFFPGECNSPRMKRRRLLFSGPESTYDTATEPSNANELYPIPMETVVAGCGSEIQQPLDVHHMASDAFWYRYGCEDVSNVFDEILEPGSNRWMTKCLEDDESTKSRDHMKITVPEDDTAEPTSELWLGAQYPVEEDAIQGPATPLPGRTTIYGSKATEQRQEPRKQQSYPKLATPVAYPFTLLKPSEAEGDITLKDINQRILMPPSRPVPHVHAHEESWPTSTTELGVGLSGKSIVMRTKIHTEGNGTITIMRTRG